MPSKISPAQLDDAVAMYVARAPMKQIIEQTGIGSTVLRRALAARGISGNRRLLSAPDGLVDDYLAGTSLKALAERHGISRPALGRMLREAGVEVRDRSAGMYTRMAQTSADERRRLASAAHQASLGRPVPLEQKVKAAATRQRRGTNTSPIELLVGEWLSQREVVGIIPQQAIGPYNVDLGADPVAVEIHGGGWHGYGRHKRRSAERYRYILDAGWSVVVVWVDNRRCPLSVAAADYIAAHVELARGDESVRGEYRVIRGDGKEMARGRDNLDELTFVPTLG